MSAESELLLILKARDDAHKVLQAATGDVEKYGWSFERVLKPALLGIAAVTGIATGAAVLFAKAAMDEQVASAQLTQALRNTGAVFAGEAPQNVETFIASLEHMSGFSRIEVMDALAGLIEQTGSYAEAMSRESVAADLARARHIDLWTASKLVGKITEENTTALARLGIIIPKGASEAQAFAIIMQAVGGSAAAFGKTAAGQWAILGDRFTDLKAKLGEALLPVLVQVAQRLTEFIENVVRSGEVEKFAEAIRSMADSFFEAAARVGAFFADIQAVGLSDAIQNLLSDIVNKLREQLPKLGAKLDAMGPVGVALKFALEAGAASLVLGFAELFFGNVLRALRTVAGLGVFLVGTGGLGIAITAGIILGIAIDQVIGEKGEANLFKSFSDITWWTKLLGVGVAAAAVTAGAPAILTIAITALLVITIDTILGQTDATKQIEMDGACKRALGPNAHWNGSQCVVAAPPGGPGEGHPPDKPGSVAGRQPTPPDRWATLDDVYAAYTTNHGVMPDYAYALSVMAGKPFWSEVQSLAEGGIATKPTLAVVGDNPAGEAILPLDQMAGVTIENHFHGAVVGLDAVEDLIRQTVRDAFASGGFRGLTGRRV
jgi:hypothetical protein